MSTYVERHNPQTTPSTGIQSRHPMYQEFIEDWRTMRDCYRGERIVKEKGTVYLPPTSGMILDGLTDRNSPGYRAYDAYKMRASFPDVVNDAVEAMIGVMHHKPPVIELPAAMEPMREQATLRKESLEVLLRRINEEQLVTGRLGLMLDLPSRPQNEAGIMPYIATYVAERIINWDEGRRDGIVVDNLNMVVLDETEFERQTDFSWKVENKYRVLALGDPNEPAPDAEDDGDNTLVRNLAEGEGTYMAGVFREEVSAFNISGLITPSLRGQTLEEIPFVFINSKDIVPEPEDPPLLGLARLALTIYRGEADYRQALFMQAQDTLVIIGAGDKEEFRTGSNAVIRLPLQGDAKFIGVESEGLTEMREALQNDKNLAGQKGGQLLDTVSRERESGDALSIRVAARTSTLNQIALAGAFGLEQILKKAAMWMGLNPDEVSVQPNLDFVDDTLAAKEIVELMTAKSMGAPLSLQSIHKQMQDKGTTELEFEEELSIIESEEPLAQGSTNEDGPEMDDEGNGDSGQEESEGGNGGGDT